MAALREIFVRWQSLRQTDNHLGENRQAACAQLVALLDRAWATLPSHCDERSNGIAPSDTIALLDQYARDLIAWRATNGWLFQDQVPAMPDHIRRCSSLLHAIARLLRELADSEHIAGLILRLNVCAMKLELEMQIINRYIGDGAS